MSPLQEILENFRERTASEREKGTYFEELIRTYLCFEASYQDLYSDVWLYSDWAREHGANYGLSAQDKGIDLIALTNKTDELHAIQCKFFKEDYKIQRKDIDSFMTASGHSAFSRRLFVTTSNQMSPHVEEVLFNQQIPVSIIDLQDLENSQIEWSQYQENKMPVLRPKKELRVHQSNALRGVRGGLKMSDRGKMIMACGTGKTFTSLKIAEDVAGSGKRVLFLVPSLSLLSQTLTEWTHESASPLHSFAVCSDAEVGKKRKKSDDVVRTFVHELRYPATTDAGKLADAMTLRHDEHHMSVVFSTYHSIDVISKAQKDHGLPNFDLIICDEAHRTTGAIFDDESESNFVKIHDADFIQGRKRLYMTATPRIYGNAAKASAIQDNVTLCSMDDESLYGQELFILTFSEAVRRGLLTDYKVIVLSVDEEHVSRRLQSLLADEDNSLRVDDAGKIIGCYKALSKQGYDGAIDDGTPMKKAVAFCQVIEKSTGRAHKVSSKQIAAMFKEVVQAYQASEEKETLLNCETSHVDGSMKASEKESKIAWLKEATDENTCRILSNVRCLSEGVDVPALDAVLFLTPRNSQVDVVQSVGRVMRKAPGKEKGYVILPVVVPAGVSPEASLSDNKTYRVVWEVLQALRSHDDRFDGMINKLDLNAHDSSKMEVIAITDKIAEKSKTKGKKYRSSNSIGRKTKKQIHDENSIPLDFSANEFERALYATIVKKCGNRQHWEDWANDIAKIAQTHITRIESILANTSNIPERNAFNTFANELRADLNNSLTDAEIIEMLAQHMITRPVFEALFEDYSFASQNPVSKAMQEIVVLLEQHHLEKEADTLEQFYDSVKFRAQGIDNAAGKQRIIVELYDKFFRNAFPKMTERLGIVYTPVEVVDFILHSVNDLLKQEFNQSLGDEGVHILDPFTGTGTFITRLIQSGLISNEQLPHKFKHEIHANELVLLAYYIAAINIESAYHDVLKQDYQPFEGICLTDTFQLYEDDQPSNQSSANSQRRNRQKELDIQVIIGNPPYSAGQKDGNDNNQNLAYPKLDQSIAESYAKHSKAVNKNALYDSYIRAIRWASDRVGKQGIVGFVSNASFLDSNTADGVRKCLVEEFSQLYVFHLRGNTRTSGEIARKEGGQIFGSGSRTPIGLYFLVKNPYAQQQGQIFFHDIGDYLSREDKLKQIDVFSSVQGITEQNLWQSITPDAHNDWLNQRDESFDNFLQIGNKKDKQQLCLFNNYSRGIATARDAWCYNASKNKLAENMQSMIACYHSELKHYQLACKDLDAKDYPQITDFITLDSKRISWSDNLKRDLKKSTRHQFSDDSLVKSLYRPFTKQQFYFSRNFNERVYQIPPIFPTAQTPNKVIAVTGRGSTKPFSVMLCNVIPDLENISKSQNFPLYLYEPVTADNVQPHDTVVDGYRQLDGLSDAGLQHFHDFYQDNGLTKEDVFYYVYGLLHSETYRKCYQDNLSKQLPRIPCVKTLQGFWGFSEAGRKLAELHLNYETVTPYPAKVNADISGTLKEAYYVTKMKFKDKKDKSCVIYNARISIENIPLDAYEYIVNGKPALEWVMERQSVTTHKESGIVNDANLWATETMNNAKYPLELFLRIITVSLETMKIVHALPELDID
jgi:predicted helicase